MFGISEEDLVYVRFPRDESGARYLESVRREEIPPETFGAGPLGGSLQRPTSMVEAVERLLAPDPEEVRRASLVVPDGWLRLAFLEVDELPSGREARQEVLRWKLDRVVPVPAEDLRLVAVEDVGPAGEGSGGHRILVGFAREPLVAALEDSFLGAGIEVGRIVNRTVASLPAVEEGNGEPGLRAVVNVFRGSYGLAFSHRDEPVLYRTKGFDGETGDGRRSETILQDLRLTRGFLREQRGDEPLTDVRLLAAPAHRSEWSRWLEEGLGLQPRILTSRDLPVRGLDLSVEEAAPLLGVVLQEIR
ncbi:MAG: hypothetical protein R3234_11890 [Thermoanaerobaculia bacterium]|nr:hypothetical protein [Thermoanaerobaculia bacterium]